MKSIINVLLVLVLGASLSSCAGGEKAVAGAEAMVARSSAATSPAPEASGSKAATSLLGWWPGATERKTWTPKASWLAAATPLSTR